MVSVNKWRDFSSITLNKRMPELSQKEPFISSRTDHSILARNRQGRAILLPGESVSGGLSSVALAKEDTSVCGCVPPRSGWKTLAQGFSPGFRFGVEALC